MPPEEEKQDGIDKGHHPAPSAPSSIEGDFGSALSKKDSVGATNDEGGGDCVRDDNDDDDEVAQILLVIRHGDRWDYENPMWNSQTKRPGDPPLSSLGHLQARETGRFVDQLLASNGIDGKNVTWLSSPFLRTLQTSDDMISEMTVTKNANGIRILPECSIFEWDGNENGLWHASLPSLEERWCYFPRLDASHQSLFVPDLPEPRAQFLSRCERAIEAFNSRYPPPGRHAARSAVVMVTHAAGCIGLCRAATQLPLDGIEPAAPCSVYRMTRPSRSRSLSSSPLTSSAWRMDPALNGCVRHLSDLGSHTVPWNHFGNKHKDPHGGYTGPLDSLLVPKSVRNSIAAREMTAEP